MQATARTFGIVPAGELVILAVPYASTADVVRLYGDALAGKIIIDIFNSFTAPDDTELSTSDGSSSAQEIAKVVPASAHVVNAFNTVSGHILAQGAPLDVLSADDERSKASVSAFIESLGLRPLDVGGLAMAHRLEGISTTPACRSQQIGKRRRHRVGTPLSASINCSFEPSMDQLHL